MAQLDRPGNKKRSNIPRSQFAIPPDRYPIDTLARARNALSRVQQNGTPEEKRKVFAAVKKKYPELARRSDLIDTDGGKDDTKRKTARRALARKKANAS